MKKVLIISGHPDIACSYANKCILDEINKSIPQIEVSYLDHLYPDFNIDVPAEQAKLVNADIIIWQFPFYWYSVPALFKLWMDQVLVHGFAYGSKGKYLHGKKVILSFIVGGKESEYAYDNIMEHPVNDFLTPLVQTVRYCSMDYIDSIYSIGMMYIEGVSSKETLTVVQEKAKDHARRVIEILNKLMAE